MSYKTDVSKKAMGLMRRYPELRTGQAYFNALYKYDREKANLISGTTLDPFYVDDNFERFMDMLTRQGNSIIQM